MTFIKFKVQIELDDEVHRQRLKDIEHEYDNLLTSTAFAANILDWPLNSLPFLIKGESLGTMLGVTRKDIAIHCFFTISNNKSFNDNIYAELDQKIEQFCNLNYGPTSSHQMIYYGNGWKRNVEVTKGRGQRRRKKRQRRSTKNITTTASRNQSRSL